MVNKYRDRAAERRTAGDEAFAEEAQLLRQVAMSIDPSLPEHLQRQQLIENTKYLGGDEATTHLVRGLDTALMMRMRTKKAATTKGSQSSAQAKIAEVEAEAEVIEAAAPGLTEGEREMKRERGGGEGGGRGRERE